jgi:hypothetical protein
MFSFSNLIRYGGPKRQDSGLGTFCTESAVRQSKAMSLFVRIDNIDRAFVSPEAGRRGHPTTGGHCSDGLTGYYDFF